MYFKYFKQFFVILRSNHEKLMRAECMQMYIF